MKGFIFTYKDMLITKDKYADWLKPTKNLNSIKIYKTRYLAEKNLREYKRRLMGTGDLDLEKIKIQEVSIVIKEC